MSLANARTNIERCVERLRAGTLREQDLARVRDELESSGTPRQDILYLQARSTDLASEVVGMRLVRNGAMYEGADDPNEWPYQSVLDAIQDGWRVIEFPNLALLLDESRAYGLGVEFILEKIEAA